MSRDAVTEKRIKQEGEFVAQSYMYMAYAAGILSFLDWTLGMAWCAIMLLSMSRISLTTRDTVAKPAEPAGAHEMRW